MIAYRERGQWKNPQVSGLSVLVDGGTLIQETVAQERFIDGGGVGI